MLFCEIFISEFSVRLHESLELYLSNNFYETQGLGVRLGGGKSDVKFYVTPVKAGQVIVEVGGPFEYFEVMKILLNIL